MLCCLLNCNAADQEGVSCVQLLNWNSLRIDDQILEVMTLVRDVNETLSTIKATVSSTQKILADWLATPMFDRKEGKVHSSTLCK